MPVAVEASASTASNSAAAAGKAFAARICSRVWLVQVGVGGGLERELSHTRS